MIRYRTIAILFHNIYPSYLSHNVRIINVSIQDQTPSSIQDLKKKNANPRDRNKNPTEIANTHMLHVWNIYQYVPEQDHPVL